MPYSVILAAFVIFTATAAILYLRFRLQPATQWAGRVSRRMAELRGRLDAITNPPRSQRSAAERLADELFEAQKRSVDVSALARYPGLGPRLVENLREHGLRTLADAEKHTKQFFMLKGKIENFGEKREEDLKNATQQCLADERARFDRGASEQGQEYRRRLEKLSAQEREQAAAKAREKSALEACIDRTREFESVASQVTFIRSLLGQVRIDPELMSRAFPEVELSSVQTNPSLPSQEAVEPSSPKPTPASPMSKAVAHLQACCRFALLAARADGRIANAERAMIRRLLGDQFGSDALLLRHLDPQLEQAEANLPEESAAIAAIQALTPKAEWVALYRLAESVIDAGGDRSERENAFLSRLAVAFEIEPSNGAEAPPPPTSEPAAAAAPDPREILEIPPKAEIDAELIRRKFRMLTEQFDPEKARLLGPEFVAMAEAKRAAVREAAEKLLAPLNQPLEIPTSPQPPKDLRHNPALDDLFK